jgi:uncharacterized protein with PIN domain
MSRPLWQLLVHELDFDNGQELTCEECFAVLEYYADLLACGANPEKLHQPMHRHLAHCPNCRKQFQQWIKHLEGNQD